MSVKSEEITKLLSKQIQKLDLKMEVKETGHVLQVGDGIAKIYGLENAQSGEMLKFDSGVYGLIFNLEEHEVGCVILGIPSPSIGKSRVLFKPILYSLSTNFSGFSL